MRKETSILKLGQLFVLSLAMLPVAARAQTQHTYQVTILPNIMSNWFGPGQSLDDFSGNYWNSIPQTDAPPSFTFAQITFTTPDITNLTGIYQVEVSMPSSYDSVFGSTGANLVPASKGWFAAVQYTPGNLYSPSRPDELDIEVYYETPGSTQEYDFVLHLPTGSLGVGTALDESVIYKNWLVESGQVAFEQYGLVSAVSVELPPAPPPVNLGNANVCPSGQTSPAPCSQTATLNYTLPANTTFAAPLVLTQGVQSLDFTLASNTCTGTLAAASSCAVQINFTPVAPGFRTGAVELTDASGNVLTTFFVNGVGVGPGVAFGPGSQKTIPVNGLNGPQGIALDAAGNLFVTDNSANVFKISPGVAQSTLGSFQGAANEIQGISVDGAGNVFVCDTRLGPFEFRAVSAGSGYAFALRNEYLGGCLDVTPDGSGNLFVASPLDFDFLTNTVTKILPDLSQTMVVSGLSNPSGLAVDAAGDVFIADAGHNQILELSPNGNSTAVLTGLSGPLGVAVDAAGDLFVADTGNNRVLELPAGASTPISIGSGLNQPHKVAVDAAGDVFIADTGNNRIVELQRSQAPAFSFATTNVDSFSSDSPQSATIQNIGNQPLNAVTPGLTIGANFVQVPGSPADCSSGFSLPAGGSCNLSISFIPQTSGSLTGAATFTDNALNASSATQAITLFGTGVKIASSAVLALVSASQAALGTVANLSVTVSASSGTPAGTVTFMDGATTLGIATLANGTASFTSSALPLGNNSITAVYAGSGAYLGATSNAVSVVSTGSTAVTLKVLVPKLVYPLPFVLAVTITPNGKTPPTGSVSFYDGAALIGTSPLPAFTDGFTFGITLSPLNVGTHSLIAVYSGDKNYPAGQSALQTAAVTPAPTHLMLACSPANGKVVYGNSYTCTAMVTADVLLPASGTLSYTIDTTTSSAALKNGTAQITVTQPAIGLHSVTASFAAQGNYGASGPVVQTFTVQKH